MRRTEFFSSPSGFSCALGHCLGRWTGTQEADPSRSWRRQHTPVRAFLWGCSTCWPQKRLHFLLYFSFWSWLMGQYGVEALWGWAEEGNKTFTFWWQWMLVCTQTFILFPEKWWLAMTELIILYSWKGAAFCFAGKIQSVHLMTSSQCFRLMVLFVGLLGFFGFAFFFSCWKSTWKKKKKCSEFLVISWCLFLSLIGIDEVL